MVIQKRKKKRKRELQTIAKTELQTITELQIFGSLSLIPSSEPSKGRLIYWVDWLLPQHRLPGAMLEISAKISMKNLSTMAI